ncbi:type I restriction enzyme, S subunit [Corynebacterium diphtheriae]|nr:type I restriction enzyme, S subunit [Corynebacterium diphtheriae]CAB1014625.1 type I restriction enzyme, S subunit [Corynebacterium diphtheriae]
MVNFVELGSLAEIRTGSTPTRFLQLTEKCEGIPFVTPSDFSHKDQIVSTNRVVAVEALKNLRSRLVPAKSTCVTCIGSTLGKTGFVKNQVLTNQQINSVTATPGKAHDRYLYYAILNGAPQLKDIAGGSASPILNKTDFGKLLVPAAGLRRQLAIADVLGALDDKIAANQRVVNSITDLQSAIWNRAIKDVERVPVESVALPQLGGTPARKVQENWTNEIPWSSVADMTAANGKYLLSTAEGISAECAKTRRFAPLPAGAVLLSARGTVGKVVTLVSPTSFNQSAYGFAEPENRSAALRLAIEGIVEELRSKSYGSVFSTITKGTILECTVPNVFHEEYFDLHSHLGMLEDRAISAVKENQVLARTRDELLPLLMNGKITVAEAKEAAGDVGVVKQNQQEEGDGSV